MKRQETEEKSAVIKLLDLVWKNTNAASPHSWERLNRAMRAALELAIGCGLEFELGDYAHILSAYNTRKWIGASDEWVYTLAIAVENGSAIASFEAKKVRQPIIADKVHLEDHSGFIHTSSINRDRCRLCVGASLPWRGAKVFVNSFGDGYVNACSYKDTQSYRGPIDKRFKITRDDIVQERAERKERDALLGQLQVAIDKGVDRKKVLKALGVKSRDNLNQIALVKLREVVAKYASAEVSTNG